MDEQNKIGLDTSVIVRLLIGEPVKQFERAKLYIEKNIHKNTFVVTDLVISEVYFTLTYHYKIPKSMALDQIKQIFDSDMIKSAPDNIGANVLKKGDRSRVGFMDQLIHAQYNLYVKSILSFDKSLCKLDKVIDLNSLIAS